MRLTLAKFMDKIGVGRVLMPYETQPWVFYDEDQGVTCAAEVRMGPEAADAEAEIQFLHDEDEDSEESGKREQIMFLHAEPVAGDEWTVKVLRVKGEDYERKFYDWEGKGCEFFKACVQAMNMGSLPDVDALIEKELQDDDGFGGGSSGRIGRKSPKVKPAQLLGMKKPM